MARLTRRIFESWADIVQAAWGHVLFFVPKIYGTDAMLLTLFSFALMNMALCLRRHSERAGYAAILKSVVPSVIVLVVLIVGILKFDDIEQRNEAYGYFIGAVQYVASDLLAFVNSLPDGVIRIGVGVVRLLLFFLIVPLTPVLLHMPRSGCDRICGWTGTRWRRGCGVSPEGSRSCWR